MFLSAFFELIGLCSVSVKSQSLLSFCLSFENPSSSSIQTYFSIIKYMDPHGSPVLIYIIAWTLFCCVIYQSLIEIIHSLLIKSFISINHVQFLLNNLIFWLCEAPKLMKNKKKLTCILLLYTSVVLCVLTSIDCWLTFWPPKLI